MRIKWSPLSIRQVTDIAQFIAEDKPTAANKWVDSVFATVEKLSTFPLAGRIVPELQREDVRELIHGNYRIIYQVSQSEVEILTLRHGKQLTGEDDILK
jgi:addiction module RelE/StbE family toxin